MNYLNLSPGAAPLVVKVSEGDIGREISFMLVEDGLEYSIPTGSTITCEILKSDGHGTSIPCTWSGSVVTLETTEQSTIRAGKATAELRIVNGADDIGTANFIMAVEPRPINADTDQTDSSYSQTGDAGDVWTLGSNGVPSWSPSGLDASSATAGQAPIADGAGGWAWGDVQGGGSVPTSVRQALFTLLNNAVYRDTGLQDEKSIIQSWATEITAISVSPTTLNINGMNQRTIVATTQPAGGIVTWSSSDESIATVSGGVVTPTGVNGSCTITASCGGKSATCAVTVSGFATLVSISATYTQSGTVYDTDSLDDLKSDLVVTANYDDSRSVPVTGYTLSGTLEVGTSTITVAYGGKSDTFDVTVSASYAVGYTEVGSPAITDNILTVADGKFVKTNVPFTQGSDSWEVICKYRSTESLGAYTDIFGSVDSNNASARGFLFELNNATGSSGSMFASSNGTSWDITASQPINSLPVASSWVWLSMAFTGTAYVTKTSTDGETWTNQKEIASTTPFYDDSYSVGFGLKRNGYLKGEIDLTGCKIYKNGSLWWKAVA